MKKIEYKVEYRSFSVASNELQTWLTGMGEKGWEAMVCKITDPAIHVYEGHWGQPTIRADISGFFVFKKVSEVEETEG
jgi:hypothetical protein